MPILLRSSAHTLVSEKESHFLWESLDQAKVQQAHTGLWRAGPDPGLLSPWYQRVWGGQEGPPCIFLPMHILCTVPDVHQIPGESCRGALPCLYKQENMTTICPKGFLVPWQHTKHEILPPFPERIFKAGDRLVGRRAPRCYRNNMDRCRSYYCRTPGSCQNCRNESIGVDTSLQSIFSFMIIKSLILYWCIFFSSHINSFWFPGKVRLLHTVSHSPEGPRRGE